MAINILPPSYEDDQSSLTSEKYDTSDSDTSMPDDFESQRPPKRTRLSSHKLTSQILVPGELITSETEWMRGHGTYTSPLESANITSSLLGPLTRTNRLLSTAPLRSRYVPSIGDLVIGRIIAVEKSRWKVDIGAPLLATLALSSINLPGGVLRRKTGADELQMRRYFQEGDLVVSEVGEISRDGTAGLHTRSLRYGKLRDGTLIVVAGQGTGTGGTVIRGRRQTFTLGSQGVVTGDDMESGFVDVVLGVNGFIWLSKHTDADATNATTPKPGLGKGVGGVHLSISNLDDAVSNAIYSSQNDSIGEGTRRAIAKVGACIRCLVEGGVRVDEEGVGKAVETLADIGLDEGEDESGRLDVTTRRRILDSVLR